MTPAFTKWINNTITHSIALLLLPLAALAADKVELQVHGFNEYVHLSVGEYPALALDHADNGRTVDITHMFAAGSNNLRIEAFNLGNQAAYVQADVLVNGLVAHSIRCSSDQAPCGSDAQADASQYNANGTIQHDLYYDETFALNLNDLPPPVALTVQHSGLNSNERGAIYLNDRYTGFSVADNHTFYLPQGSYTIAVGAGSEALVAKPGYRKYFGSVQSTTVNLFTYTGRYFEQRINLGANTTLNLANTPELGVQDAIKVRIVPIQTTEVYTQSDNNPEVFVGTYQLDTQYIARFTEMVEETSKHYLRPLSYGLNTFNVSTHPLVTQAPVKELNTSINSTLFLEQAGIANLRDEYDLVIFLYGNSGTNVAWTGGKFTSVPQSFIENNVTVADPSGHPILSSSTNEKEVPNELVLHETLHVYEGLLSSWHYQWRGIDGLHGAEMHGYHNESETHPNRLSDWMQWYQPFIRGQVVEPNSFRYGVNQAAPATSCGSLCRYTGVFKVARHGFSLQEGVYTIRNLWRTGQYLNPEAGITVYPLGDQEVLWHVERVPSVEADSRYFWLKNAADTSEYLFVDTSNHLVMQNVSASDQRGQWLLGGYGNDIRLQNRATGQFLSMEFADQTLALTTFATHPSLYNWWSARWLFRAWDGPKTSPEPSFSVTLQAEDHQRTSGTVDTNHNGYTGSGFVNTNNAVNESVTFSFQAPVSGSYTVHVRYANGGSTGRPVSVSVDGSIVLASLDCASTGAWSNWLNATAELPLVSGPHTLSLVALTSAGVPNLDSITLTVQAAEPPLNQAPTVTNAIGEQYLAQFAEHVLIDLNSVFADADGDLLSFNLNTSSTLNQVTLQGAQLEIATATPGTASYLVSADDGRGGHAQTHFNLEVYEAAPVNLPPQVTGSINDYTAPQNAQPEEINLLNLFSDPDGDALNFSGASSQPALGNVSINGHLLTVTATDVGNLTYTVTASDDNGGEASISFSVTITSDTQAFNLVVQAESGTSSSGSAVESEHGGFSGTGYVNTPNQTGSWTEFTVTTPTAGSYAVTVRYANGSSSNRCAVVLLNGNPVISALAFQGTGAWHNWQSQSFLVELSAGTQTLRLRAATSGGVVNVDSFTVTRQ